MLSKLGATQLGDLSHLRMRGSNQIQIWSRITSKRATQDPFRATPPIEDRSDKRAEV